MLNNNLTKENIQLPRYNILQLIFLCNFYQEIIALKVKWVLIILRPERVFCNMCL